jgi:hypothetical protein
MLERMAAKLGSDVPFLLVLDEQAFMAGGDGATSARTVDSGMHWERLPGEVEGDFLDRVKAEAGAGTRPVVWCDEGDMLL